jgi:hypothetical protein
VFGLSKKPAGSIQPAVLAQLELLFTQQRFAEVLVLGEKFVARYPRNPDGYAALARAIERLWALIERKPANEVEASFALAEALHRAGRKDERAAVFTARSTLRFDRAKAIEQLESTARAARNPLLKRIAGFEAVRLLDQDARFREAFDLASFVHRETTPPFDAGAIDADVTEQLRLIQKGRAWFSPKSTEGEGTACRGNVSKRYDAA